MRKGLVVHATWEAFLTAPPEERSLELLESNILVAWADQKATAPEFDEKIWTKARDETLRMVNNYWEEFGNDTSLTSGHCETTLNHTVIDGVILQARLDYLVGNDDYELKTTGRTPRMEQYLYFNPQLRYQAWLMWKQGLQPVVHPTVLWPTGAARWHWAISPRILKATEDELQRVAGEIQKAEITAREGWHCTLCPFMENCVDRITVGGLTTPSIMKVEEGESAEES
mgnify:CR=1 FL=1